MTQPRGSGVDPIGDFQRWLIRSGARSMTRELSGHIAGALGLSGRPGDVWESATAPPLEEAPECAWCPVCRAARLLRVSGPGLASHVATASDTLASLVQEAASVVESALAAGRQPEPGPVRARDAQAQPGWAGEAGAVWEGAVAGAADEGDADADAGVWAEATRNGPVVSNGNGAAASGSGDGPQPPSLPE